MNMLKFCVCGAGRIGQVHAENIARNPRAELAYVVDINVEFAKSITDRFGGKAISNVEEALADPSVGAVLIASPTPTHVELIHRSSAAGKAIFCEKPIDLDMTKVDLALEAVRKAEVPFFVGFNRRFDPSFQRLKSELAQGALGQLEMLTITSRDPSPPPPSYVQASGGLFRDMMIHDFDMARWLLGEEPVELYATASNLVDPEIGAMGDVDTAMVVLKTQSGVLCHISNSRRANYGYDQRIEAFGAKGALLAGNHQESTVQRWGEAGLVQDKPLHFFLERYDAAYKAEMEHFIDGVAAQSPLFLTGPHDGRQALALADAAEQALRSGGPVRR